MKIGDNWYVHAPWAQLVCCTELPEDKVIKFLALSNEILDEAKEKEFEEYHDGGIVPLHWTISQDHFQKYDVLNYIMEMVQHYMETILNNGNIKSHLDTILPGGPHTHWHSRLTDAWVVSQKEDDYIPMHTRHLNSKISGILYLKMPEVLDRKREKIGIQGGKDGQLAFSGVGGVDPFSTTMQYNCYPEIGWMYLFPSTLNHQVYPFKGKGEIRGVSFNIDVISKEQFELIEQSVLEEKEQNATE